MKKNLLRNAVLHTTLLMLFVSAAAYSQIGERMLGGRITGTVVDKASGQPLEYANVILFNAEDSSQVTGIATNAAGKFELTRIKLGKYYADVHFIGFQKKRIDNISIARGNLFYDAGEIALTATGIQLGGVVVEGERPTVSYHIDKKVVDVAQMQTVISGNAADVLQNVPSVTVDIEGNVSLRGSTNFTVLVDGRPSILDAQDILQQVPASSIQTIEIVTNPSAKYDPEGTAGIINIILKKTEDVGLHGMSNINAGLNDKYGGDVLFEVKSGSYNANIGMDYNKRYFPNTNKREEVYTIGGTTTTINSNGNSTWGRTFWSMRSGMEFLLGAHDVISVSGRYGARDMRGTSNLHFLEQSPVSALQYINKSNREWGGDFFGITMNYQSKFQRSGHELKSQFTYSNRNSDEITLTESFSGNILTNGKRTSEIGPSKEIEGKIDYTLPLGIKNKFEAGYQGELDWSNEMNGLEEFNSALSMYESLAQFTHNTRYTENEQAIYSIYSDEWSNLGAQIGARAEYTYRVIELPEKSELFTTDQWDFFPTVHASYKFSEGQQLMGSYTRRIRRPRGWALEPFFTWVDANNVRRGNPSLKNEYVDSYEVGAQTSIQKIFLSGETYYKVTHNKIEEVRSAYSENTTLTTFENIGTDYSLGAEFQMNVNPMTMWSVNLMGNVYQYRVEGILYGVPFSRESFNWNARLNNSLKFSQATQLQFNAMYNSPSVSSQGKREGFFTTDLSLRQDLFERTFSVILQIRDLFKTGKQEFTSQGAGYYSYYYQQGEAPMVMLSIKYLFNNYQPEERRRQTDDSGGFNEGEGF